MSVLMSAMGEETKHISLKFDANDFDFIQDEDGNYCIISKEYNWVFKGDTLQPALPYFGYNVLVPQEQSYISHTSKDVKTLVGNNIVLARTLEPVPTNQRPLSIRKKTLKYNQDVYPSNYVELTDVIEYKNYKILTFHVCPFEYNTVSNKLYLRTNVSIDITLDDTSHDMPCSTDNKSNEENFDLLMQLVVNPENVMGQKNSNTFGAGTESDLHLQTGYEYVIITSNLLKEPFLRLAQWKSRKGIRSLVLTVEQIASEYTGSSKAEKIKNALADIEGLSYVLLGGDTLNVPTCMCYIGSDKKARTDSITPSDSYYACVEQIDWDGDVNGRCGELSDSVNLLPTLYVSRAPVSTVTDAQVFVERIITYESMPDTTNWQDNILMAGKTLGYYTVDNVWYPYYINGKSDTQLWSQKIYDEYIAPNSPSTPSWNCELTRLYDTYSDYSGDDTYDLNAQNLQTELGKGYTFVDMMTHGNKCLWQMEGNNLSYQHNNARSLVNTGYSVITTTACLSNAFDYQTSYRKCLSQELINNPSSGVLSYWGTSRENWYYPRSVYSITLGNLYDALTYREVIKDKYHRMGKATTAVKFLRGPSISKNEYTAERKIWFGLNLMGDPEMPVYMFKPRTFSNVIIELVNDSIYIGTELSDYDVCFKSQIDSTQYYIARNIADSHVVFSRCDGVLDGCITSPGFIPYLTICDTTYFQNTVLEGIKTYETDTFIIGSDVTSKVNQGPVVVDSGNIVIKSHRETTISRDFEVRQGAEFFITNE